jgi:formylglycine-generating enzyme required for sulfatase activity
VKQMMKTFAWLLICSSFAASGADATGFIQVKCDPGVQIFLDGNLKGITNADVGGMIMQDVPAGRHEIRAVKPGFQPQVDAVAVAADQVVAFAVKPFVPKVQISQEGEEQQTEVRLKVGSLQIQSVPIECSLSIAGLGVSNQAKTKDRWKAAGVPVGKYTIVAEGLGKRLTHKVEVWENGTAEVLLNFVSSEVKDLGAARRATMAAEAKTREKEHEAVRAEARKQGIAFPDGWAFVPVKPGAFTMGSPPNETGRHGDEKPHQVTLAKSFWMSTTETTQSQYEDVVGRNPSERKGPQLPVERVSWDDVQDFLRRFNERERQAGRLPKGWAYRLPTEAEWEYACRAGTKTAYSSGDGVGKLEEYAWYDGNSGRTTHQVGTKKPNAWGLYDMHGNVLEWCSDWHADYNVDKQTDPKGAAGGSSRVIRGGCWYNSFKDCRSAIRFQDSPSSRDYSLGFRLVMAVP